MPNQRRHGQTLISFACEEALVAEMDRARGHDSRSQMIRKALVAYLQCLGMKVDPRLMEAPDRAGVGGRPRKAKKKAVSYRKVKKPKPPKQ